MRLIEKQSVKFIKDFGHVTELFDSIESVSVVFDSTNKDGELAQYIARFTWDDDKNDWFLKIDKII